MGIDEATHTPMVAYRSPETGITWFRTLANFTEKVEAPGIGGRTVVYRRFSRVGRPKADGPMSGRANGLLVVEKERFGDKEPSGIDRGRTSATERGSGEADEAYAHLAEIRAICCEAGVDCVSVVESVKTIAYRARKWSDFKEACEAPSDVSQNGKPAVGVIDLLLKLRDVWSSLQCTISRLDTAMLYSGASFGGTPLAVIEAIRENANQASTYLDETMTEVEYAHGIEPGEPD